MRAGGWLVLLLALAGCCGAGANPFGQGQDQECKAKDGQGRHSPAIVCADGSTTTYGMVWVIRATCEL